MCINEEKNKYEKLKKLLPSIKIIYMIFIKNKQRRFKIMPMKKDYPVPLVLLLFSVR